MLLIDSKTVGSENVLEFNWELEEHDTEDFTTLECLIYHSEVDDQDSDDLKPKSRSVVYSTLFLILCSVTLHALILYAINLHIPISNLKEKEVKPTIIKAVLYTPKKLEVEHEQETNKGIERVVIEDENDRIETREIEELVIDGKNDRTETKKTEEVLPDIIEYSSTSSEEAHNHQLSKTSKEIPIEALQVKAESILDNSLKHIRQLEQTKLNGLTSQASKNYQYNKAHPKINGSPRKLSADEQVQKSIEREVNCTTMTGKVLNILSGLGHGTAIGKGPVKCFKSNEANSFIKKRVTKAIEPPPAK